MDVALKVLPTVLSASPRAVQSLKNEAKVSMTLTHPNIVRLHNFDDSGPVKFLVMEYVNGKTLDQLLEEKKQFTLKVLWPIAHQVAEGLDYAHFKKVLHRDIKPSNIMVAADGTVKIMDFGIARQMRDSVTQVTGGRETAGTLLYMSPEQLMGQKLDHRSDLYSFATVLYECLAGHPPFHTGDVASQIRFGEPAAIKALDDVTNEALQADLAKEPQERPKTAGDLVSGLDSATPQAASEGGSPVPSRPAARKTTGRVALADVVPVKTRAELAWAEAQKIKGGEGLETRLEECRLAAVNARAFYDKDAHRDAKAEYERLLELCQEVTRLDGKRHAAHEPPPSGALSSFTIKGELSTDWEPLAFGIGQAIEYTIGEKL